MNITIMSRKEIEKLITNDFPENVAVISFRDTDDNSEIEFYGLPKCLFEIKIDDIEIDELDEFGLNSSTYFPEAEKLAQFIKSVVMRNMDIICQCEYGQSRSAACAAAILEVFEGNGISIFSDYRYYPNKLIYNKLVENLKRRIDMDNIVLTGFTDIDYQMKGFRDSELILIAARPSMGKTSFALNIARNVTTNQNITTLFYSLELSKKQILYRTRNIAWEDKTKFIIDDEPGISVDELIIKSRRYKSEQDIGLIIIDYLQLLRDEGLESRQLEMSIITQKLKKLACEISIPIIVISQYPHTIDHREDKKPILQDLRYIGAIEQDFDTIMFLYRDEIYNNDTDEKGITEVIVPKCYCRNIATVWLYFFSDRCNFANLSDGVKSLKIEISRPDTEYKDLGKRIRYLGDKEFEKNVLKTFLEKGYDLMNEESYGKGKCTTRIYTFGRVVASVWSTCYAEIKVVNADAKSLNIVFRGKNYNSYEDVLHKIIDVLD